MAEHVHPLPSKELSRKRQELAPEIGAALQEFSNEVFADGALPSKTKQLIAVAVAHVTQEAIWVAAEMRAGAAFAHSTVALETMVEGRGA